MEDGGVFHRESKCPEIPAFVRARPCSSSMSAKILHLARLSKMFFELSLQGGAFTGVEPCSRPLIEAFVFSETQYS